MSPNVALICSFGAMAYVALGIILLIARREIH